MLKVTELENKNKCAAVNTQSGAIKIPQPV